jgi:hypothetical protein
VAVDQQSIGHVRSLVRLVRGLPASAVASVGSHSRAVASHLLLQTVPRRTRRLIVFLTPGYLWRTGGVMSIASIYRESISLAPIHNATVVLCTLPDDPRLLRYTWFKNRNYILDFEAVLRRCEQIDWLMLHIPEYAVNRMVTWLARARFTLLARVHHLHLNVMLQNIDQIADQDIGALREYGVVTCTTAHDRYSTRETRSSLGVPLHRLSVLLGPEMYTAVPYEQKKNLLLVSPDAHPLKRLVLSAVSAALPGLDIRVISNVSHEQYKMWLRQAKWMITFGEGLDGYFVESVFSGGVPFAVYNDRFFTPEFALHETVYASWEVCAQSIATDLRRLDTPGAYQRCWGDLNTLLSRIYRTEQFRHNLRRFYMGDYTVP